MTQGFKLIEDALGNIYLRTTFNFVLSNSR